MPGQHSQPNLTSLGQPGVCMINCNLSTALLAEWPGSFMCQCSNIWWNGEENSPSAPAANWIHNLLLTGQMLYQQAILAFHVYFCILCSHHVFVVTCIVTIVSVPCIVTVHLVFCFCTPHSHHALFLYPTQTPCVVSVSCIDNMYCFCFLHSHHVLLLYPAQSPCVTFVSRTVTMCCLCFLDSHHVLLLYPAQSPCVVSVSCSNHVLFLHPA